MAVQVKRFSWVRSYTAWEQTQRWRERRAALRSDFELANQTLANGFATATSNVIQGQGTLAAQQALARIEAAAKAKLDTSA